MRFITALISFMAFQSTVSADELASDRQFLLPEVACEIQNISGSSDPYTVDNSDTCFQTVSAQMDEHTKNSTDAYLMRSQSTKSDDIIPYIGSSFLGTHKKRTDVVIISIHGLWSDGSQFETFNEYFYNRGANILSVVLPGHGFDATSGQKTTYEDWILQTHRAVQIAKQLGKKVILMGQSTGGLLAVDYATQYPADVAGLLLLEPALQVRGLPKLGSCTLGKVVGKGLTRTVGNMLGYGLTKESTPRLGLGCEVHKLASMFNKENRSASTQSEIPIFAFINNKDRIVNSSNSIERIQTLFKNVDTVGYDPAGLEKYKLKKAAHGLVSDLRFFFETTQNGKERLKNFFTQITGSSDFLTEKNAIHRSAQWTPAIIIDRLQITQDHIDQYINSNTKDPHQALEVALFLLPTLINFQTFETKKPEAVVTNASFKDHENSRNEFMRRLELRFQPSSEYLKIYKELGEENKLGRLRLYPSTPNYNFAHTAFQKWSLYQTTKDGKFITLIDDPKKLQFTEDQKIYLNELIKRFYDSRLLENLISVVEN